MILWLIIMLSYFPLRVLNSKNEIKSSVWNLFTIFIKFLFFFSNSEKWMDRSPKRQVSLGFTPSVLCTGLHVNCSVNVWMFPSLPSCLSKGRKGLQLDWPGLQQSESSFKENKSLPLKPNRRLNTKCCSCV